MEKPYENKELPHSRDDKDLKKCPDCMKWFDPKVEHHMVLEKPAAGGRCVSIRRQ
jgi:hypothetical protein